jgi:hypothetical protein
MTRGIPKKRQRDEQLRKERAQAASVLAQGAMKPLKAISVAPRPQRPPVGLSRAVSGPLPAQLPPAHHYPVTRAAIGKRQTPGGS